MELFKAIFNPVFLIIALFALGILLLGLKKGEKIAKVFLVVSFFGLFFLSFTPFSNFLLWGLESRYPPLMDLRGYAEIKYIVVLTAWDSDDPTIPYTSNLGYRSAFRILEAHRIYREIPKSGIIISGSEVGGKLMSKLMGLLGVPTAKIDIDHSQNTLASAKNLRETLEGKRFMLVTSALHMPRSVTSFVREGLEPIPAPGDYLYGYYPKYRFPFPRPFTYYVPNTDSLMRSSAALYEYFGILWYKGLEIKSR